MRKVTTLSLTKADLLRAKRLMKHHELTFTGLVRLLLKKEEKRLRKEGESLEALMWQPPEAFDMYGGDVRGGVDDYGSVE